MIQQNILMDLETVQATGRGWRCPHQISWGGKSSTPSSKGPLWPKNASKYLGPAALDPPYSSMYPQSVIGPSTS